MSGIYLEPGSDKQTCDWESGIDEFYAAKVGGGGGGEFLSKCFCLFNISSVKILFKKKH